MTILQSLVSHYDRVISRPDASILVPAYGYSRENISFCVILSAQGEIVDIADHRDMSGKKPRPKKLMVPTPLMRTSAAKSFYLWDKTAYVFGVKKSADPDNNLLDAASREHSTFVEFHKEMIGDNDDVGLQALLTFLTEKWNAKYYLDLRSANDMLDTNIVFKLDRDDHLLHERRAAKDSWDRYMSHSEQEQGLCLVTGKYEPIERVHPAIKGVLGAQTSGAAIVSFNRPAFLSYGKDQGYNAPISKRAAFAYTALLTSLVSQQSVRVGDMTVVFWAEAPEAERMITVWLEPPREDDTEAVLVHDQLQKIAHGVPLKNVVPEIGSDTRYYILGLAPNASRLSVRFWQQGSFGELAKRLHEHWCDLRVEPADHSLPSARNLVNETAVTVKRDGKRKVLYKTVPPLLAGETLRAILTGIEYPHSLLTAIIMRLRADQYVNSRRVAIIRACLVRNLRKRNRLQTEDYLMSLNRDESDQAYRLGRLFAILEQVQRYALGNVNATIRDRYYGAASATPEAIFPMILRTTTHHIANLRKGKGADWVKNPKASAVWFDKEISQIISGFDLDFPKSLDVKGQGRFAIGYYQQRFTKAADASGDVADVAIGDGIGDNINDNNED